MKLNGSISIPIRHILTILTGLVMIIGSYYALQGRINTLQETKAEKEDVQAINARLMSIEGKLDLIIQGKIK